MFERLRQLLSPQKLFERRRIFREMVGAQAIASCESHENLSRMTALLGKPAVAPKE